MCMCIYIHTYTHTPLSADSVFSLLNHFASLQQTTCEFLEEMLLLWGILHVHVSNQPLLVAPVGKGSSCATEGVRGKPAWEMNRQWKDWLEYRCLEQTGVQAGVGYK